MKIQYLGQAGFLVEGSHSKILIDPYLSNFVVSGDYGSAEMFSRNFPPPIQPEEITGVEAIFITHDHADHCDLETLSKIRANNPESLFIGPKPVRDHLLSNPDFTRSRIISVTNERACFGGIEFVSVAAAHPDLEAGIHAGEAECVGYLIRIDDIVIYHSGDTVLYNSLVDELLSVQWAIDVACLPVNGRDTKREMLGIVGNLDIDEAINLALSIKAQLLIPMHNDLFTVNQDDPEKVNAIIANENRIYIKQMMAGDYLAF